MTWNGTEWFDQSDCQFPCYCTDFDDSPGLFVNEVRFGICKQDTSSASSGSSSGSSLSSDSSGSSGSSGSSVSSSPSSSQSSSSGSSSPSSGSSSSGSAAPCGTCLYEYFVLGGWQLVTNSCTGACVCDPSLLPGVGFPGEFYSTNCKP